MSRKFALLLATAALTLPTAAYASCSGNLCSFVAVKETDYGPKDEILKLTLLTNTKRPEWISDIVYVMPGSHAERRLPWVSKLRKPNTLRCATSNPIIKWR